MCQEHRKIGVGGPRGWNDGSVPLGKYRRGSPPVFSFEPRCQGPAGPQKQLQRFPLLLRKLLPLGRLVLALPFVPGGSAGEEACARPGSVGHAWALPVTQLPQAVRPAASASATLVHVGSCRR
ncbi:hypothetical protein GCM10010405_50890 [Streptomyces macrosporus]|uniref:Uncharacterized protein n=1 Tax=Streptomyces macrosporus TaxID=44032 RepID=A0ABP5XR62_9ACTN